MYSSYGQEEGGGASHLSDYTSSLTKFPRHKESKLYIFFEVGVQYFLKIKDIEVKYKTLNLFRSSCSQQ